MGLEAEEARCFGHLVKVQADYIPFAADELMESYDKQGVARSEILQDSGSSVGSQS